MKGTSSTTSTSGEPSSFLDRVPSFVRRPAGRLVFGPGCSTQVGEAARELGKTVLLVTDPGLEAAGHSSKIANILRDAGCRLIPFTEVRENPTEREVRAGVELAKGKEIDLLVAVGGGSAMDCAKGINFLLTNGGKMEDYKGYGRALKPMLPSIGIPTTTGTGSEAQSYALITHASTHMKMACGDAKAAFRVAFLDPLLTLTQPKSVLAATAIDAVTHAVESYVSTAANPISRLYSRSAWQVLSRAFVPAMAEPNVGAYSELQLGAYLSGMAIENSMLGVSHACANPITAHYGLTHGIAVSILLPHVIRFNAKNVESAYSELAGSSSTLIEKIGEFQRAARLPTCFRECDVSESILHLMAEEAMGQWTARFNPRPVTEEDLVELYNAAF